MKTLIIIALLAFVAAIVLTLYIIRKGKKSTSGGNAGYEPTGEKDPKHNSTQPRI